MTDHKYTECSSCYRDLNEYELEDPCDIDGRLFCDRCASEFIAFRCGTLRNCADMVKELKPFSINEYAYNYFGYENRNRN